MRQQLKRVSLRLRFHVGCYSKGLRVMHRERICTKLDISRAALYRYERGNITKIETIERIAGLLGMSCEQLMSPLSEAEQETMKCHFSQRELDEAS